MNKYTTRVVSLKVGDEEYLGLEIPAEIITNMNLKDGEILDADVSDGSLILKRTGIIGDGN